MGCPVVVGESGWGLGVMGRRELQEEIARAAEELFALQNPDGGWPDRIVTVVSSGRESAEYLTGQIVWTMIQAGLRPEREPRLEKAARWLLARQRDFGGWFQTGTTGENFQTPQRETRYAVMALAAAYPRERKSKGWGNRDGRPARPPRTGTVLETLDDLDNLWQAVPRPPFTEPETEALAGRIYDYVWQRSVSGPSLVAA